MPGGNKRKLDRVHEEEEDFPRGGKSILTKEEIEEAKSQAEAEFAKESGQRSAKKRRADFDVDTTLSGNAPSGIDILRHKNLSAGMRILGAVSDINNDLSISLPNGLYGFAKQEEILENGEGSLKQLFNLGELVVCTVLSCEQPQADEKKKTLLSLLPQRLYEGITIDGISIGQLMVASVKSIEDHGYILSFGVPNISGFLQHKDYVAGEAEKKLSLGKIVHGIVKAVDKKRGLVNLRVNLIDPSSSMVKEHDTLSLQSLLPGAVVNARVQSVVKNGILVSFLKYFTGMVDVYHLTEDYPSKNWADGYSEGQRVQGRIIFNDMVSKTIGLSLRPHLLESRRLLPRVEVGRIIDGAVVRRVDAGHGLLLELPTEPTSVPGYVQQSAVSDETIEKLDSKFKEGKKVKGRVVGYRLIDGLASVTLKESAVNGVLDSLSLKAGVIVHGVVNKVGTYGAIVSLGEGVTALCTLQHMSDLNLVKPSSKFTIGSKFKFRVLQCDLANKKLTVTRKRLLLSSKLPRITSYEDAVEGLVTHGWIQGITDAGCFVEFYNGVKGLVHRSQMGLDMGTSETDFQVGQVVKCRVLRSDPSTKKLSLSFTFIPRFEEICEKDFGPGSIVSGATITHIGEEGLVLQVPFPKGTLPATMAHQHLCDTASHVEQMAPLLKVGYTFDRLLVLDVLESKLLLSAKHSLISAADSIPSTHRQLAPQAVVQGFVSGLREKGCIVQFLGKLKGFVHIRHVSDAFIEDASQAVHAGQSVRAQVLEVDPDGEKLFLSLKQSVCFSTNASLIESYIMEEERIAQLKMLEDEKFSLGWANSLPIGSVIDAEIQEVKEYGIILNLKANADVVGFATHYQAKGDVKRGDAVKARILDVVKMEGIVDLSLRKNIFPTTSIKLAFEMHQKVEAVVELVKDEYLVLSIPKYDHAIAYASSRDYNNRTVRVHDRFKPGQRFSATVYNPGNENSAGRVLLLLGDAVTERTKSVSRKEKHGVGVLVEGQIVEIESLFMTVDIGGKRKGKVHVTQVNDEYKPGHPFSGYTIGQTVKAKMLNQRIGKASIELSLRPSVLSETSEVEDSAATFETVRVGQNVVGYVQEVADEWAWLLLAPHLRGRLHILDSSDDLTEIERFKERFQTGVAVSCHVSKVDHASKILDLKVRSGGSEIKNGDVIPGRIARVHPGVGGLSIQVAPGVFGTVHVTHLGDAWMDHPENLFKKGSFVRCKVLKVTTGSGGNTKLELSLRPSQGGSGGFESIPSFSRSEVSAHVESVKDVRPNMKVQGFVKMVTKKGCFVVLAPNLEAKVLLKNMSEKFIEEPAAAFPTGKLVTGSIVNADQLSGRVEMSLASRSSRETPVKQFEDFHVGDVVTGRVKRAEKFGTFIKLDGSDIVAMCHKSEIPDNFYETVGLMAGDEVRAKIIKIDSEKRRISLGLKKSHFKEEDEASDMEVDVEEAAAPNVPTPMQVEMAETYDDFDEDEMPLAVEPLEVVLDEDTEEQAPPEDIPTTAPEERKVSKRVMKRMKQEREAAVRAAEEKLLQNDQPPETVDDFEKLVRTSPNSSFVWIKYMGFLLKLGDVDKARVVAERALDTINYREEEEKMNIWMAFLNLENTFGDPPKEAVLKLFQRALVNCDPKKLHLNLLEVYQKTNQHDMFDEFMKSAIKKFRSSAKVWLLQMTNLLARKLETRKTFDQALASLPRDKHIKFISQCALLEFKSGDPEKARTMLDGVLRNYPKRTDLWSVYLDQEIRLGDSTVVRNLFERVICLDLPPKKMKFLFKKYLDYEKSQGDEDRIEHVKAKAMEYVERNS